MPSILLAAGAVIHTPAGPIRIGGVAGDHVRVSVPQGVPVERGPQDLLARFGGYHRRHLDVFDDLVAAIDADESARVRLDAIYHDVRAARVRESGRSNDKMAEEYIPLYGLLIRMLRPDLAPRIGSRLQVDVDRLIDLCGEAGRYEAAERKRVEIDAAYAAEVEQFVGSLDFDDESNEPD